MCRYHLGTRLLLTLAILTLNTAIAFGQTAAARPDRGVMPNGSYSVSDVENLSLQNGNVNLNIPLAALPPIAGGELSWSFNAYYNSKVWDVVRTEQLGEAFDLSEHSYVVDSVQQSERGGWRVTGQYGFEIRDAHDDFNYQIPPVGDEPDRTLLINNNWYKTVFVMPDGSEHELRPVDYSPFNGGRSHLFGYYKESPFTHGTMRYYSYDGSYIYATITASGDWTAYLPDGTRAMQTGGIQRIQDTNGNKIKIFTDSNGTHYQDEQTGREIRYFYDPAGNGGKGQGQVWYQAVGGTWMHIDINFDTTAVQGKLYTQLMTGCRVSLTRTHASIKHCFPKLCRWSKRSFSHNPSQANRRAGSLLLTTRMRLKAPPQVGCASRAAGAGHLTPEQSPRAGAR